MLIICPNCAKSYHIARATIGAEGRPVQCSKCFSRWQCQDQASDQGGSRTSAAEPLSAAQTVSRVETAGSTIDAAAVARRARDRYEGIYGQPGRKSRPGGMRPARSWMPFAQCCAALGLVSAGMAAVSARATIVEHAPALAVLYQGIGLPVNTRGIAFTDVRSAMGVDGATPVLSVEGKLTNLRAASVTVPEIVASLQGTDGRALYSWKSQAPKASLAPGETASFRTRLAAPPNGGQTVVLRFASAADSIVTAGKTGR